MSYHERCDALNKNPVLVVRQFQYRVELFFKTIILDDPLGKTNYYAIHVQFQVRGSPHVHSFIWILNTPKSSKFNIEEYANWVDMVIRTDLPDPSSVPDLHELVKDIKSIATQNLALNIEMKNVDFILVNFLLVELSLHNLCQILHQLTRKMR